MKKNTWVAPTEEQTLRCRLVSETIHTAMINTGTTPTVMWASREFLKPFDYEDQTVVEIWGTRMFLDDKLTGISCYWRKQ